MFFHITDAIASRDNRLLIHVNHIISKHLAKTHFTRVSYLRTYEFDKFRVASHTRYFCDISRIISTIPRLLKR